MSKKHRGLGGFIGASRLSVGSSGIFSITERLTFSPREDGLSSSSSARSAAFLKETYPAYGNGNYWININGTPTLVYCDMTSDGGGWMLYSSFGANNPLSPTASPAIAGNQIVLGSLSTNGYTTATQSGSTFYYIDGQGNNTGYVIDEPDNGSWFAFFDSSGPKGYLYMNHFKLITPVASQIRIRWGDPTNLNQQSSATLFVNGGATTQINNNVQTNVLSYTPNNTVGANSIYIEETSGIAGVSWIYVR